MSDKSYALENIYKTKAIKTRLEPSKTVIDCLRFNGILKRKLHNFDKGLFNVTEG